MTRHNTKTTHISDAALKRAVRKTVRKICAQWDKNWPPDPEVLDRALACGIVEKRDSWYWWGERRLGQERENVLTWLEENPDERRALVAEIDKILNVALSDVFQRGLPATREAVARYRELAKVCPDDDFQRRYAEALLGLGRLLRASGHLEESLAVARQAVVAWCEVAELEPHRANDLLVALDNLEIEST